MTSPLGVGRGSTTTLKELVPRKTWSRSPELIGSGAPWASTLALESSRVQVDPPSIERRNPTPRLIEDWKVAPPLSPSPYPVDAKMIDLLGSLLRPKTAMEPMLRLKVGPRSVRGTQVGPLGSVVRKFRVFQM